MVRANRRKGIEEVYGTKMEALQPVRMQPSVQPGMTKTAAMRATSSRQGDQARTQRSYVTANDYYITTNVPLNATNMRPAASAVMAHPSKTSQMPAQVQAASAQMLNYGSMSNRRLKPSARQTPPGQPAKVHFLAADGKAHSHPRPHVHTHPYAKSMPMPMQMTQRTVYGTHSDVDAAELSDKDQMRSTRRSHMHSHQNPKLNQQHLHPHPHVHPLQHQLHQQQQLLHPSNDISNNNMHQMHQHSHMKHQQQQQQQQQRGAGHSHQRGIQVPTEEDDKDEDPEEFFELIRQTVKNAVGTTISELVTRNFRDLASRMEHFSNELKTTNDNLGKLQSEVTNKVMHYGEENTRHFRYLCMKSEYDKMLYQHQAIAVGKQLPSKAAPRPLANTKPMPAALPNRVANMKSVKQATGRKINYGKEKKAVNECSVKVQNPCACHSTSKSSRQPIEEQQSSSERSVNVKSSELGVREMLGQIQRFCTQMQLSDMKEEPPKYNSQTGLSTMELGKKPSRGSSNVTISSSRKNANQKAGVRPGDADDMDMETPIDSMDEIEIDNFQYSSDEVSSYSDDSEVKFTGSTTARAPLQSSRLKLQNQNSNKGAGDGQ